MFRQYHVGGRKHRACCGHQPILPSWVTDRLRLGQVGGWFAEGAELGPRALGCRSILADPRFAASRDRINGDVKRREAFRPLAPAVLAEHGNEWFDSGGDTSPFMLRTWRFRPGRAELVPAVVHVDGTGRVQTWSAPNSLASTRCSRSSTG